MAKAALLLILALIIGGCASSGNSANSSKNRYDSIDKQTSFVSVRFPMESQELVGKTRSEIKGLLGNPARVQKKKSPANNELWIYYPKDTNNFVAILITFVGNTVKECSYESVM
ncbi:MAG: hypothetical protein ABII88_00830 [Candidatus Omnitrophota bacterium]